MKYLKHAPRVTVLVLALALALGLAGCAGTGAPAETNCNAKIQWQVAREVQLTRFDCALGKHGGQPALIFTVGLANPTAKPWRYRVNIFLQDFNKGAGYLVPRKGKPPVIGPGQATTVKIPFIGQDQASQKILVVVKTLGG